MSVLETLDSAIAELLRADERRVLLGEDVADGGMLGLSRSAVADPELRERVLATPLNSSAALSHATGLALAGLRPMVLLPSAAALLEAMSALRELARLRGLDGDVDAAERSALPVLIVAPAGPGFGLGGDAALSPEAALTTIPGLRVVAPGLAEDFAPTLRGAASFDAGPDPVVLLLPRRELLRRVEAEVVDSRAIDSARVHCEGDAATLFAWGSSLAPALEAAAQAAETLERGICVVDVGSLAPLDEATLVEAARRTGKLVIAQAGPLGGGPGAELAALLADQAVLTLDAPILRVGGAPDPVDDAGWLPGVDAIADALLTVATY